MKKINIYKYFELNKPNNNYNLLAVFANLKLYGTERKKEKKLG